MPRQMPNGLQQWLATKNKRAERHITAQISIVTTTLIRNYYYATGALDLNGIKWLPQLRRDSQIKTSLTRSADQATVELQNVDTELGVAFLAIYKQLYGQEIKVGRYWKDLDSGAEFHKVFLTGVIIGLQVNQETVRLTAVSDAYASISVGATRRVALTCGWVFRDPSTCGYNGTLQTCNYLLNHADGCQGRHGDPQKRAKIAAFAYLNSGNRLKTI